MEKSEIRKDYFLDKYVIIAPKRAKRPQPVEKTETCTTSCYFCPDKLAGDEKITYTHKNDDGKWDILVMNNRYPALSEENPRAFGLQEIVIETRVHCQELQEFSTEHIVNVLNSYIDRYEKLNEINGIKHVIVFKNEGGKAGASISHSHSQIIALPLVPPKAVEEAEAFVRYELEHNSCPYCDIIQKEAGKNRVIWEDKNLFVFAPYASDSPYGAWFVPKRHMKNFTELTYSEKESFAKAMKIVLAKLDELGISYNYFFENAVNSEDYHTHMKLSPRPNIWAGLELGTGVIINPIPPEFAAKVYKDEIKIEYSAERPNRINIPK